MKKAYIFLILTALAVLFTVNFPQARPKQGILVVIDRSKSSMAREEAGIKKIIIKHRTKAGRDSNSLPVFLYDFSNPQARQYCERKLGIKESELIFMGIVNVEGNHPVALAYKIPNLRDVDQNVKLLVKQIVNPPGGWQGDSEPEPPAENDVVLSITSNPTGARVYLNGMFSGVTPLYLKNVKPGTYKVYVKKEEQNGDAKKWEGAVQVVPGRTEKISANLETLVPSGDFETPQTPVSTETPITRGVTEAFIPVYASNGIFQITVSNLEEESRIKSHYQPKPDNKFVVVYLSQQNVSNEMQVYTGKISLLDRNGNRYEPMDNLSNFWMVVLKPGGMNLGYLVYELPKGGIPVAVELTGLDMPPLRVKF